MNASVIIEHIRELAPGEASALPPRTCLLGLDLGEKTIGMAISDDSRMIASPLDTIRRTKFTKDAEALLAVFPDYNVGGIILGLPVNMDGTEGPRCQSARAFARNFESVFDMEMAFWDERLSTAAVTRTMLDADLSRARQKEVVDKMAASYILQGALDFMANHLATFDASGSDQEGSF